MADSGVNYETGSMESRMSLLEKNVSAIQESVGNLMTKVVDGLLSEKSGGEQSTVISTPARTPVSPPASLLQLAERGDAKALIGMLSDQQVNHRENPPRTARGDTALHLAATGGHLGAVMALLGAGAMTNSIGSRRRTPLHCAAAHGHLRVAQRLLDAGAEVGAVDADGATALDLATDCEDVELVSCFIDLFVKKGASINTCKKNGYPILDHAAKEKKWDMVQMMLEKGAAPSTSSKNGSCALVYAAKEGQIDAFCQLLRGGAASNEEQVKNALRAAKSAAVVWTIVDLLPDVVASAGVFALRDAAHEGRLEPMVALLEAGVKEVDMNDRSLTALYSAAEKGHVKCVEELLRKGSDHKAKGPYGNTPLHIASSNGHVECVRALLAAGASSAAQNDGYKTPRSVATTQEVRLLFEQ